MCTLYRTSSISGEYKYHDKPISIGNRNYYLKNYSDIDLIIYLHNEHNMDCIRGNIEDATKSVKIASRYQSWNTVKNCLKLLCIKYLNYLDLNLVLFLDERENDNAAIKCVAINNIVTYIDSVQLINKILPLFPNLKRIKFSTDTFPRCCPQHTRRLSAC